MNTTNQGSPNRLSPKRDTADEVRRRKAAADKKIQERHRTLALEYEVRQKKISEERVRNEREMKERAAKELKKQQEALQRRLEALERDKQRKKEILEKNHAATSRTAPSHNKSFAFGSSTPRELSYLDSLPKDQKAYDKRLSPPAMERSMVVPPTRSAARVSSLMATSMYVPASSSNVRAAPVPRTPKNPSRAPVNLMTQSVHSTPIGRLAAPRLTPLARNLTKTIATAPTTPASNVRTARLSSSSFATPKTPATTVNARKPAVGQGKPPVPKISTPARRSILPKNINHVMTHPPTPVVGELPELEDDMTGEVSVEMPEIEDIVEATVEVSANEADVVTAGQPNGEDRTQPVVDNFGAFSSHEESSSVPHHVVEEQIEQVKFIASPILMELPTEINHQENSVAESVNVLTPRDDSIGVSDSTPVLLVDIANLVDFSSELDVVSDQVHTEAVLVNERSQGSLYNNSLESFALPGTVETPVSSNLTAALSLADELHGANLIVTSTAESIVGDESDDAAVISVGQDVRGTSPTEFEKNSEKPERIPENDNTSKPPSPPITFSSIDREAIERKREEDRRQSEEIKARLAAVRAKTRGRISPPSVPASTDSSGTTTEAVVSTPSGISASTAAILQRLKNSGKAGTGVSKILERHASDPKLDLTPEDPVSLSAAN